MASIGRLHECYHQKFKNNPTYEYIFHVIPGTHTHVNTHIIIINFVSESRGTLLFQSWSLLPKFIISANDLISQRRTHDIVHWRLPTPPSPHHHCRQKVFSACSL